MSNTQHTDVTALLRRLRGGDAEAFDQLMPLLYGELHSMARGQLRRRGRPGRTLDTTALVHEAYLKLAGSERQGWNDRRHFLAVAATAMRQIIVDAARARKAAKRGADAEHLWLDQVLVGANPRALDLVILDQSLDKLTELGPRLTKVVELRLFAGLTEREIADVLEVSERTVRSEWRKARALLAIFLGEAGA